MAIAGTPVVRYTTQQQAGQRLRGIFTPWAVDLDIIAADTTTKTLIALKAGFTIFVTRAVFNITTAAAQTLTLQDSADTPVPIFKTVASATGSQDVEFGDDGTGLTEGKNLDVALSAAGLAGRLHVEGYYRQTSPVIPSGA